MKKLSKKGKVVLAVSMAVFALTCTVGVGMSKSKAAEFDDTYISSKYGYLDGGVDYIGSSVKQCYSYAQTTKANVPKIRAKGSLKYYNSGATITSDNTGWILNSDFAQTKVMSTSGKYNTQKSVYNNFTGTKLKVYGTADAIVTNAYVVYTSGTWQ